MKFMTFLYHHDKRKYFFCFVKEEGRKIFNIIPLKIKNKGHLYHIEACLRQFLRFYLFNWFVFVHFLREVRIVFVSNRKHNLKHPPVKLFLFYNPQDETVLLNIRNECTRYVIGGE